MLQRNFDEWLKSNSSILRNSSLAKAKRVYNTLLESEECYAASRILRDNRCYTTQPTQTEQPVNPYTYVHNNISQTNPTGSFAEQVVMSRSFLPEEVQNNLELNNVGLTYPRQGRVATSAPSYSVFFDEDEDQY